MKNEEIVKILEAFKNFYEKRAKETVYRERISCNGKVNAYLDAIQLLTDENYAQSMYAIWVDEE